MIRIEERKPGDCTVASGQSRAQDIKGFLMTGHSSRCKVVIDKREHALVGISPFNSRFSPFYVRELLKWVDENFLSFDVLLPDERSAAMIVMAASGSTEKAMKKSRKEMKRHRRALRCIKNESSWSHDWRVVEFSDYSMDSRYVEMMEKARLEFESNESFRMVCLEMVRMAVGCRASVTGGCQVLDNDVMDSAVSYIFSEIPFYLDSPSIMGVASSVLIYHRKWPIGDLLFSGEMGVVVSSSQAHGVVRPV